MRCDNGLIGLGLYVLMIFAIFIHCFRTYWSYGSIPIKMCALTAGASLMGVFVTLYSENTVNYSMATLSMPFGFYGMMLGLIKGEQEKDEW
jgi:O-antigen ligase